MALLPIPNDFGAGGANLSEGTPTLREILQNHVEEIEAAAEGSVDQVARDAATDAQETAEAAQTTANETADVAAGAQITAGFAVDRIGTVFIPTEGGNLNGNVDATINPGPASRFSKYTMIDGSVAEDHTLTLGTAGNPPMGLVIAICLVAQVGENGTYSVVNGGPGMGTLFVFGNGAAVGCPEEATFKFDGTDWEFVAFRYVISAGA